MKGILFGAVLAALGQNACAREYPYAVAPGLPAVVTVSGLPDQRLRVRVGDGPEHEVARLGGDEEVDQFQSVDVDRDGYRDFAIGQSGGGTQVHARIFLYRPQERAFRELPHPDSASSPCHGYVNPVFDETRPAFAVACRYGAAEYGFEEYTVCPDGTARATSWSRQSGESVRRLRPPGPKAGACRAQPKR